MKTYKNTNNSLKYIFIENFLIQYASVLYFLWLLLIILILCFYNILLYLLVYIITCKT